MGFFFGLSACSVAIGVYGLCLWFFPLCPATVLLGILVCCWPVSLLHELGHLLAYRLLNLQWKRMRFSCLIWEPGKGMHLDRQGNFFAAGCTCAYDAQIPLWRYEIALLSGSLFCLLLCAGAAIGCLLCAGGLRVFFLCFSIACGLNALCNLLPFSKDRSLLKQIKKERENIL